MEHTVNNPRLTVPTNLVRAKGRMLRPKSDLAIFSYFAFCCWLAVTRKSKHLSMWMNVGRSHSSSRVETTFMPRLATLIRIGAVYDINVEYLNTDSLHSGGTRRA